VLNCFRFLAASFACLFAENGSRVIEEVLVKYERPFTFLGIGEKTALYVDHLAPLHPDSTFVVLDKTAGNMSLENIVWLNHQLQFHEAQALSACEHVDVLLLSDSLLAFGDRWKEALQAFQKMAHVVIIEMSENEEVHSYLCQANASNPTNYYVLEGQEPFSLIKTTMIHPKKTRWKYEIYCDYKRKYLKKIRPNWTADTPWFPGINLMTYLMFNGTVPTRHQILANMPIDQKHSDWVTNNMIVQGNTIILIDKDDPVSTPVIEDGGKRFRNLQKKAKNFILTTQNMSPSQVRETFISIYNWGTYFDRTEIDE
jgi:hypothetical protein